VQLHPSVVIGSNCRIDAGVVLHHNVTLGDRVIIQSNTVLGGDAFYYKKRPTGYDRMISCGSVVIEDDVEIGPCCTIDRGVSADTRIGAGTKIDCQVQIGHDTVVGKHCLMASQVGVSGACIIEDDVTLWGQVGVPSKVHIGKGAVFLGQSGIMPGFSEGGKTYFGSPAAEKRLKFRELAALQQLPDLISKLKK
jgi:UDP-3-O-[3-hydroxymyristoyl] glucosamine N-acyltransferase